MFGEKQSDGHHNQAWTSQKHLQHKGRQNMYLYQTCWSKSQARTKSFFSWSSQVNYKYLTNNGIIGQFIQSIRKV